MRHKRTTELRYPGFQRGCVADLTTTLGPSGTALRDRSAFKNHGLISTGMSILPVSGKQAITLSGSSSQLVNTGANVACQLQTFSISFWIYAGTQVASYNFPGVIGYGRNGWEVGYDRVNNTLVLAKSWVAATTQTAIPITQNVWAHIVITCLDVAGTKTVAFYKNGTLISTSSPFVQTFTFGESTSQLVIGRESGPTVPQDSFFTGSIADVLIWNRILTTKETSVMSLKSGITNETVRRRARVRSLSNRRRRLLTGMV
jgi:hypothetical protein